MKMALPNEPVPCHIARMSKTPKRPRDPNQLAKLVVDIATGEDPAEKVVPNEARIKAATAGGKAQSAKLTEHRRSEIATAAARERWG